MVNRDRLKHDELELLVECGVIQKGESVYMYKDRALWTHDSPEMYSILNDIWGLLRKQYSIDCIKDIINRKQKRW